MSCSKTVEIKANIGWEHFYSKSEVGQYLTVDSCLKPIMIITAELGARHAGARAVSHG